MFCPKCGAQNKVEQKFCRGCGQALSSVRMALEGKVDDLAKTLAKNLDTAASGTLTLAIFVVIALLANFISGSSVAINLILGLLIGGTIAYKGIKRLDRTIKLLDPKEQTQGKVESAQAQPALAQPQHPVAALPAVPDTDPLTANPTPASVTEHTTFHLKRSK